jgi:xanthine phosphoribosyltransferase
MHLLEEKIRREGQVFEGDVLKVDSFLNHQIDVQFLCEIGKEFRRLFDGCDITKILTIEASGIGIACIAAQYFDVPVVFAKKSMSVNIAGDVYTAPVTSFTRKKNYDIVVSKSFLHPEDKVLVIDDFLAEGSALLGLTSLVQDAGATLVGAGIVIEKAFQPGGKLIRDKGVRVESLARIASMSVEDGVQFC